LGQKERKDYSMDGVGATSSITSLVDLGKRLYDFWKAIEDAPGEIQEIKETVISLKSIIDEIANQYNGLLAPFRSIEQVLEQAKNKVQELLKYLETIDIGRSSVRRRKWASIKAALRQEKVAKFRAGMESTKASLILAQSLILR
jgi:serine phosphatase RsbU (regulator of sigma subunit)